MCGITGFFDPSGFDARSAADATGRMCAALVHRGPDGAGVWVDGAAGIALAHRRLSILDLSVAGHQPMVSSCQRFVATFNGEIYNHLELRAELERSLAAPSWRGHSDTETFLAAIGAWGLEATLKKSAGMFALALWDRQRRVLTLARDRLGEKPLYYGWLGSVLVFGSELKALRAHPHFAKEIDAEALALYMRHNYVPTPWSIYKGVWKLPAGSFLSIDAHAAPEQGTPQVYWSARAAALSGLSRAFPGGEREAADELERLIKQSIAGQMIADVPVGAFLSGGIDSSTVVALMQEQSSRPVKTFSIGFHEDAYNEAHHASLVARHLKTDHVELYVTPQQALEVVPRLPGLYDEPFGDSSQVPTFLMMALAREHVTVALSGDGGDELLGGYNRYFWGMEIWRRVIQVPSRLRHFAAAMLTSISPRSWDAGFRHVGAVLPRAMRYNSLGDKIHKLAGILTAPQPEAIYKELVSQWSTPPVCDLREPMTAVTDPRMWLEGVPFPQQMMFIDLITYLPDDILVKVDRAAMGVSLETRVPLLDHRLVEFAWQVPLAMKIRSGQGKWLLRQVLDRYVPRKLVDRPKMGFGVPIDAWLRDPLRDWAETLLSEANLSDQGYLDPAPIRKRWAEHISGRCNWHYSLWTALMFQAWLHETSRSSTQQPARAVAGRHTPNTVIAAEPYAA